MKKVILSGLALMMLLGGTTLTGCSYGGVAMSGDKAIILQNDMFLLGALRKVFVCQVAGDALTCKQVETP